MRKLLLVVVLTLVAGCAAATAKPEVVVLHHGSTVLQSATKLQEAVTSGMEAKSIPVPLGQEITGYVEKLYDLSGKLKVATDAYHAATDATTRGLKAADVQTIITDMNATVAKILGVKVPDATVANINRLVGDVMVAIGAVQGQVAAGLGAK